MKKRRLLGPFGGVIEKHLQLRRSLGFSLRTDELALDEFDRFVAQHFPVAERVTRPMVVSYLQSLGHLSLSTRYDRIVTLRQFCRFLFQLNPETYIPEKALLPGRHSQFQPHIYTVTELNDLIRLALQLPPAGSLRPHTYATLIGLLWVSGLRSGEALRLNLEDVDLERSILHIRQTKNTKSRLVPFLPSAQNALLAYRDLRAQHGHDPSLGTPFFINERARRCAQRTVDATFRALTRQLGLKSAYGGEPRLHDFRHTWATRCLTELYQTGKDPNAYLPVLATYLGHVNIASTTIYLHPSADLLSRAGSKFHSYVNGGELALRGGEHERL